MKQIVIIIAFLITATSMLAQTKFTAAAPRAVGLGEQFRLIFTLNAKGANFQMPDLSKDFDVLAGPSTSTSSSMQILNGQVTQDFSYSYTYILQAKKEGKFNISAATVVVDQKQYTSNPLTIEVVKGNAANSNSNQSGNGGGNQQQGISNKDIYVAVSVNKTSLYQGEHLVATIKVYTKLDLAGFENMKLPSYKGFYSQDIETPQQIQLQRENVNGEIYNVGVIKQNLLFPQQTGTITIESFVLDCVVRQRVSRRGGFFDDFFGGGYQNAKVKLKSNPVKINVTPLPSAGKPADFTGAVGKFEMETSIDKENVKSNDAITLKIKISGNGNLKLIDPLKVEFPSDFEVYDPKISENIKNIASGSSGHKSFDYLIIPRHAGNYKIPSFSFTYFDTDSKKYKTLQSKDFVINVEKGNDDESVAVVSGLSKEDVKLIGSDIRYIKTNNFNVTPKGSNIYGSIGFYISYIGSLLIFILIFIFRRKAITERANVMLVRNKKANKVSRKRLKIANVFLKANDKEHFYDEVLKAIWGYLSDKLSIPLSQLQRDTAVESLIKLNIDKELLDRLLLLLDTCEFARYAPSSEASKMDEIYNNASTLINTLEAKIK